MLVSDEEIARRKNDGPAARARKRDALAGAVSLHRRATRQRRRHGNGGEISRRRTEDAAPQSLEISEVLMSPPRLTEASLHSVRSGTILPTYDRGAHSLRNRAHRPGRVSPRAPGVLRRHAAALRQALGDLRAVAQEHRAARRAGAAAGPVHAGGARRRAARARHRRDSRAAGRRDRHRRGIRAPHRARYAHRLAHGHRKGLLPRRAESARRRQCRHRARSGEPGKAAQHHRLARRRSASPARAGRAAVSRC